jgi:hypothetical protein
MMATTWVAMCAVMSEKVCAICSLVRWVGETVRGAGLEGGVDHDLRSQRSPLGWGPERPPGHQEPDTGEAAARSSISCLSDTALTELPLLLQIIVGANTLAQSAIPALFPPVGTVSPEAESLERFYEHYVGTLEANARLVVERAATVPGLEVVVPQGAMYVMLRIKDGAFADLRDDVEFSQRLLQEENIVVLPGQCFGISGFIRVVFAPPHDKLAEAFDRLEAFCRRHSAHSRSP